VTATDPKPARREAACPTCGRPFDLTLLCVDCRAAFVLTQMQQKFFIERGLALPRRCESCRADRRHGRRSPRATQGPQMEDGDEQPQ